MRFEIDGVVVLRFDYGERFDGSCSWEEFKEEAKCNGLLINDYEAEFITKSLFESK
ncbi:hypothetical protein [Bacillus cereus group sp. BfR-BA-01489]|uniref:hypothetical protein n=1 Tax=Bacillus cereus group sp. BfR-BA-01489 TaxID=2920358 RepID=UPI001F57ACD6